MVGWCYLIALFTVYCGHAVGWINAGFHWSVLIGPSIGSINIRGPGRCIRRSIFQETPSSALVLPWVRMLTSSAIYRDPYFFYVDRGNLVISSLQRNSGWSLYQKNEVFKLPHTNNAGIIWEKHTLCLLATLRIVTRASNSKVRSIKLSGVSSTSFRKLLQTRQVGDCNGRQKEQRDSWEQKAKFEQRREGTGQQFTCHYLSCWMQWTAGSCLPCMTTDAMRNS